jgi:hypothetical protein
LGATDKDRHRPWLGYALEESLRKTLYSAKDIVAHVNAEALVAQLPHQVISELLARALASGTFSPAQILETAPPALLAEYLEGELLWRCLKDVAERSGISKKGATRAAPAQQWLAGVLQRALDCDLVTPADVLRFLPPTEFVGAAPRPVVAELIKNGLVRGSFDPAMVLQHLTPAVIAEHLETSLVWSCIADSVSRQIDGGSLGKMMLDEPTHVGGPPVMDKTTPPVPALAGKSKTGSTASGRIDNGPPRPPGTPPTKAANANGGGSEWRPGDELDVLEEEILPLRSRP